MDAKASGPLATYDSVSSARYLNKLQHLKKTMGICPNSLDSLENGTQSNFSKICEYNETFNMDNFINPTDSYFQITIAKKTAIVLGVLAIIANMMSLLAIAKIRKKLNANLRLTTSLCVADILVAISLLILSANTELLPYRAACLYQIFKGIRMGAHIMTLFNLLGLALDHYYAIVRTLHYKFVMSNAKITWAIIISWIIALLLGFSDLYMPSAIFDYCQVEENSSSAIAICDRAACTVFDSEHLVYAITMVTFCSILYIYTAIFVKLQKKVTFMTVHHRGMMQRKKKGLCTTILILVTFVVCWLPYCLFDITINVILVFSTNTKMDYKHLWLLQKINFQAQFCLYDLILLNSLCDPIIYAWRMREVQRGYKDLARMLPCCKKILKTSFSRRSGSRTPTTPTNTTRSTDLQEWNKLTCIVKQQSQSANLDASIS